MSHLRVVLVPISPSRFSDSSSIWIPSVCARIRMIWFISSDEYGSVLTIMTRSKRSRGIPCGAKISVPLKRKMIEFQTLSSSDCAAPLRTALHGTTRCSMMARHGVARHNTARHNTARRSRHSTARHSTALHSTAWHSVAWHNTVWHSTARHDTWCSMAWHSTARYSATWHNTA